MWFWCRTYIRPPSVDSLHGGATDVFTQAPIEKKSRKLIFFILASRPYIWNYWSDNNGSTIKICRISRGMQLEYFQDISSNKLCSDILKIKISTVFNCFSNVWKRKKGIRLLGRKHGRLENTLCLFGLVTCGFFKCYPSFFSSRPTDSNFHK